MNIHYGPKSIVTLSLSSLPPSILALDPWPWHWPSLCTQPYNFAHILLQNIAQDIFYNFAPILLQNNAQENFHNFAHILLQDIAQDIF